MPKAFKHVVESNGRTYTYFRTFITAPDGKRRPIQAATKKEAEQKAQDELRKYRLGLDPDATKITVETFMQRFLEFIKPGAGNVEVEVSPSVYADYGYHVTRHINPTLGKVPVQKLTTRDVDQLLKSKSESGLSVSTVQYTHRVLRRALNFAVDWGVIERNPASARMRSAKRKFRPAAGSEKIRFFTPEQAEKFLVAARDDRHEALFVTALTTGTRPGEQFALQWDDVRFDAGTITIRRAIHRTKRKKGDKGDSWILRSPKTAGSRRTLTIPAVAVEALRRHQDRQREQRLLAGDRWIEGGFVFTSEKGTPLDVSNVLHHFQRVCQDNGLPKIRYYDLRHTHASLLINEGMHPKVIAERLGHSSIKLTMDTYGHLFAGSDQGAADAMDRLFRPKPDAATKTPKVTPIVRQVAVEPSRERRATKTATKTR